MQVYTCFVLVIECFAVSEDGTNKKGWWEWEPAQNATHCHLEVVSCVMKGFIRRLRSIDTQDAIPSTNRYQQMR